MRSASGRYLPMIWNWAVFLVIFGWTAAEPGIAANLLNEIEILDIETAAEIALAENPSLDAARSRVIQAAEVVRQARSRYWPRLDATTGYSRVSLSNTALQSQNSFTRAITGNANAEVDDPEDYYQADLTASWVVFDGFARKFNLAAARHGEQAFTESHRDVQRLLLSAVTFAYLQAQLAQENIAIAKADEAFNQRLLVEARLRHKVGTGALSDVLNFEVRVNDARTQRIVDERSFKDALVSLAALLGIPRGRLPDHVRLAELMPTTPEELDTLQVDHLLNIALDQRPDLKQTEWQVQQAEANARAALADYYPSIVLSGTLDGERTDDMRFESDDFGNNVALGLTWNIFSGGLTRAKHAEAKARLYELEKTQQNAYVQVASEVQKVVTLIQTAQEQLSLQETNTRLVQRQRDLVEKEYKAGVGSLVRLNEAQRDLTVAQARLAFARVALREAWYELRTVTGQILSTFKVTGSNS